MDEQRKRQRERIDRTKGLGLEKNLDHFGELDGCF